MYRCELLDIHCLIKITSDQQYSHSDCESNIQTKVYYYSVSHTMEVHKLKQAFVRPSADDDKTLDDLAREVLMVDEHDKSLIPGYLKSTLCSLHSYSFTHLPQPHTTPQS